MTKQINDKGSDWWPSKGAPATAFQLLRLFNSKLLLKRLNAQEIMVPPGT